MAWTSCKGCNRVINPKDVDEKGLCVYCQDAPTPKPSKKGNK